MHIFLKSGQNLLKSEFPTSNMETFKEHMRSKQKISRNMARDEHGPEFDDRLIKLVRENPAIYDMSHPHYRRTPVRMAIWDKVAKELDSPSRYLQTKWKNIRYNYLQEQKCLETGIINTNIRRRRFTADLTFLKNTAYRRDTPAPGTPNVKLQYNGSDNDSYSFMYPDNLSSVNNANSFEVIELDRSDDESCEYLPDVSAFLAPMNDMTEDDSPQDPYAQPDIPDEALETANSSLRKRIAPNSQVKKELKQEDNTETPSKTEQQSISPYSPKSNRSSPLLTPMNAENSNGIANTAIKNGNIKLLSNGNASLLSEVTIRPVLSTQSLPYKQRPSSSTPTTGPCLQNNTKRRTTPTLQTSSMNDPIELYCLSLVDCLRAMPRSERERVKFEFSKILKDARYINQS